MSNYGPPPPPPSGPYGQQPPYGQTYGYPGPPGYQGYPAQPYGAPALGYAPSYASWIKRVGAYLIDMLLGMISVIPMIVGIVVMAANATSTTELDGTTSYDVDGGPVVAGIVLILVGVALGIAIFVWNIVLKQGRTGYSVGKAALGIRLVRETTGLPVGPGLSFGRYLLHVIDGAVCYLGYLWPLWDAKRQTFADKIVATVVINAPR